MNRSEKFWESPQKQHLRALYVLIRQLEGQNSGFIRGLDLALRECRARLREVRARQWSEATSKSLICFNQAAVGPKPGFYKGSIALRECRARLREVHARQWSEPTSKSLSLARESRHPENTHSSLVGFCTSGDNWLPSIASESPCACRFEANCLMSVCRISPCTRPREDPATVMSIYFH